MASTPEERADELDKQADAAQSRGEIDQAIAYYEESLAAMERFGPAYNGLLTLYNLPSCLRALMQKDNAAIEGWTSSWTSSWICQAHYAVKILRTYLCTNQ